MLVTPENRELFEVFFKTIGLNPENQNEDQKAKIEQILAYLEIINAQVKKYSVNRPITLIESCAGNCYLSFLIYFYYKSISPREVNIYCVDHNERLMEKCRQKAKDLEYETMYFHAGDVLSLEQGNNAHLVFSLHACDDATDKTIYMGIKKNAKNILSVSCCQHSIKKSFTSKSYKSVTRHRIFKDRLLYIVGDSQRALLLEMAGYSTEVIEFISSRYTGKNVMIRASRGVSMKNTDAKLEYENLIKEFRIRPKLDLFLNSI